ncbi:proteasomal ubiquitin receptor ADRM1 homolog isoform X1 [Stomoxys calcitrans]|uniref:Proteasomal ubiquitin receptor ADRM1 homolog n=1 Tax=Stomoxys calcitrans TaxID=35570 RepID=A0A1I8PI05_STOCA|nr:proteasomal ubiquitin receptor ADRM1 homolog isoform X1 [Stomoxys calcitrans]
MFGRQSLGSGGGSSGSNLVEFRAGRMNLIGKMVHPDTRKGLVYLTQSEDGLMHFCWKDRTSGKVEDDLIVFPDDFEFKRVEQCKTGRVYVLKFKSSSRRMFFWMQEPKTDKDEEHCRRVNELMNNPPSASRGGQDGGDLQYMLNNMSQQQLMQLFGGVGQMGGLSSLLGSMNRSSDSTRTPSSNRNSSSNAAGLVTPENSSAPRTPSAPKANKNKSSSSTGGTSSETGAAASASATGGKKSSNSNSPNNAFQSYLSNLSPEAGAGRTLNIDLSTALTGSEAVNDLISDPERVNSLSVHLPETEDADENKKQQIKDTIASPQFQQALSLFSSALGSAQLGPVVSQFELSPEAVAAAYSGNLEDFVKALEKALPAGATMSPTSTKGKDTTEVKKEESNESAEKKE